MTAIYDSGEEGWFHFMVYVFRYILEWRRSLIFFHFVAVHLLCICSVIAFLPFLCVCEEARL